MDSFQAAVARIHRPRGDAGDTDGDLGVVAGAGFLVTPDLLVTCAHVLGRVPPQVQVPVSFPQAEGCPRTWGRLVPGTWRDPDQQDVAFLQLESVPAEIP